MAHISSRQKRKCGFQRITVEHSNRTNQCTNRTQLIWPLEKKLSCRSLESTQPHSLKEDLHSTYRNLLRFGNDKITATWILTVPNAAVSCLNTRRLGSKCQTHDLKNNMLQTYLIDTHCGSAEVLDYHPVPKVSTDSNRYVIAPTDSRQDVRLCVQDPNFADNPQYHHLLALVRHHFQYTRGSLIARPRVPH